MALDGGKKKQKKQERSRQRAEAQQMKMKDRARYMDALVKKMFDAGVDERTMLSRGADLSAYRLMQGSMPDDFYAFNMFRIAEGRPPLPYRGDASGRLRLGPGRAPDPRPSPRRRYRGPPAR